MLGGEREFSGMPFEPTSSRGTRMVQGLIIRMVRVRAEVGNYLTSCDASRAMACLCDETAASFVAESWSLAHCELLDWARRLFGYGFATFGLGNNQGHGGKTANMRTAAAKEIGAKQKLIRQLLAC